MLRTKHVFLIAILASSAALCAQETLTTASVTGRVLDPSGAAIPLVGVTAVEQATNQLRTGQTDSQGSCRVRRRT